MTSLTIGVATLAVVISLASIAYVLNRIAEAIENLTKANYEILHIQQQDYIARINRP